MREVSITGAGMTGFGKFPEVSLRELGTSAIREALDDAGLAESDVDLVVHANAVAGLLTGQEMTRGQVVVSGTGLTGIPMINVENACAGSSTAVHVALAAIRSGAYQTALVVGTEKMSGRGTAEALGALTTAADVERLAEFNRELTGSDGPVDSFFMEIYARTTADYMARSGATARDFAEVAAKNSVHGSLNPKAQYRTARTPEEVLASRAVAGPLTMLMCSPIADGAAALVLQAGERVRDRASAVRIRASVLRSGIPGGGAVPLEQRTIDAAYAEAGIGPDDLDLAEVHDAASPNELVVCEELGLCSPGDGPKLLATGATRLGGRIPVNTSGGLVSRGHPVGATGAAQLVELVTQIRGRAGARQVEGARIGIAENAGGYTHPEAAACAVTIVSKD
ncbi:thiolase family protein [Amycolatopsis acididurans]|uniref:thiolase family protein n=1 Tax=Amycolatopsis acididurans TaxID=2724524 RepID=UPI0028ADA5CA|nr:thiolase family protein [Amycolatopsis acididurans]